MPSKLNKYLPTSEARLKFRKQCLKGKNILFENDCLQIGCKVLPFYDFYSSKNYLQVQLFIGNKTARKLQAFKIAYKATQNMELFIEEKNPKFIPENTQFKEKSILICKNYEQEILLLMDFHSEILTLKSLPIPITFYSFLAIVPQNLSTLPLTSSYAQLSDLLNSKYQYLEELPINCDMNIFRKGLLKECSKYFTNFTQHSQNLYAASFTLSNLSEEYVLGIVITSENQVKIVLAGNLYKWFDAILNNMSFLMRQS